MLEYFRKHNPKHFYYLFAEGKGEVVWQTTIFTNIFKSHVVCESSVNTGNGYDITNIEPVYEELDRDITQDEMRSVGLSGN